NIQLHLMLGLQKILLDIDKAIRIVRETEEEAEVVSNLMIGFGIDEVQAEYVAEIKLRHLNREYILRRTADIEDLKQQIAEMEAILGDIKKIRKVIADELRQVAKKYGQPRRTQFLYLDDADEYDEEDELPDYPVHLFLSESGYFKKITPQSLRMSGEQKLKEGDRMVEQHEATNRTELIFFTDKQQAYKTTVSAFDDTKASVLGDYVPAKLGFDEGESVVSMIHTTDYEGFVLFLFENGKAAKIPLKAYETKTNRRRLANAYTAKSQLVKMIFLPEDKDILVRSTNGRAIVFNTAMILPKSTRDSIGVQVMTLKAKAVVQSASIVTEAERESLQKYYIKNVPAAGALAKELPDSGQLSF
ncbi:MAG: topoisomerase IV, partial [Ruminococcus sp.]|nr:topoisomerase IV [Ruminococcus sp.]